MVRLEGRVAIVTGGGGGIGAAVVRRLVAEGARVLLSLISLKTAHERLPNPWVRKPLPSNSTPQIQNL